MVAPCRCSPSPTCPPAAPRRSPSRRCTTCSRAPSACLASPLACTTSPPCSPWSSSPPGAPATATSCRCGAGQEAGGLARSLGGELGTRGPAGVCLGIQACMRASTQHPNFPPQNLRKQMLVGAVISMAGNFLYATTVVADRWWIILLARCGCCGAPPLMPVQARVPASFLLLPAAIGDPEAACCRSPSSCTARELYTLNPASPQGHLGGGHGRRVPGHALHRRHQRHARRERRQGPALQGIPERGCQRDDAHRVGGCGWRAESIAMHGGPGVHPERPVPNIHVCPFQRCRALTE